MNWHWALDQYVSPKNNITCCQKYMKVVQYWHETIKNCRYDGDVSLQRRRGYQMVTRRREGGNRR